MDSFIFFHDTILSLRHIKKYKVSLQKTSVLFVHYAVYPFSLRNILSACPCHSQIVT